MKNIAVLLLLGTLIGCNTPHIEWVCTTPDEQWVVQDIEAAESVYEYDVEVYPEKELQTIDGFGSCFNELGWTSLNRLSVRDRETIMQELFSPGTGANFTICRMPVGANDFSRNWYSYDETDGDFAMEDFSIEQDRETLIPFIHNALKYNPDLKIWASPWSPPTWMKYNKHYASRSSRAMEEMIRERMAYQLEGADETARAQAMERIRTMFDPKFQNDLAPEKEGREGTDMCIQEEAYLKAYALYFAKFIEGYRKEGIDIFAVMPQNEFNSAQTFPSCCWTAAGLANFIGSFLGPAMEELGVDLYFGTMERPTEALVDTVLLDARSGKYIKGVGFQWAGKEALPGIHKRYPDLKLYQTEQECGDGRNDWEGAMYSWDLMKYYLNNGVSVYEYWNTSLLEGGISRWGWAQNSLVVVDSMENTYRFSYEYYVLKHASHFVLSGAKKLETWGEDGDLLAFMNPDRSLVVIVANRGEEKRIFQMKIGNHMIAPELKPNSLNTLKISGF
jgi:glucosylceramidase